MRKKPMLLGAMLSACLFSGCATNTPEIADSGCKSFKPIALSKQDTEPTKRQVVAHNKVYDALCPSKG